LSQCGSPTFMLEARLWNPNKGIALLHVLLNRRLVRTKVIGFQLRFFTAGARHVLCLV
jgi:hypothetical protein